MAQSTLAEVIAWLTEKGGLVRTVEENLLHNMCRELGWRQHGAAAQERLRHMLYELAARRTVVLEFHPDDQSRIAMVCLAEKSAEAVELARLRAQLQERRDQVGELRGQLQAAAPDVAAALQLAEDAEAAKQLAQDQLADVRQQLTTLQATIDEEIRQVRAAHPRVQDKQEIRRLTNLLRVVRGELDRRDQELHQATELAAGIPGYQAQIRALRRTAPKATSEI